MVTTNLIINRDQEDLEDSPRLTLMLNSDLPVFNEDDLVVLKDKI